eukprot:737655-Prymnesium_polylepis.1
MQQGLLWRPSPAFVEVGGRSPQTADGEAADAEASSADGEAVGNTVAIGSGAPPAAVLEDVDPLPPDVAVHLYSSAEEVTTAAATEVQMRSAAEPEKPTAKPKALLAKWRAGLPVFVSQEEVFRMLMCLFVHSIMHAAQESAQAELREQMQARERAEARANLAEADAAQQRVHAWRVEARAARAQADAAQQMDKVRAAEAVAEGPWWAAPSR